MKPEHLDLLLQALPFINKFKGKTFVVKIGGDIAEDDEGLNTFCEEVALLVQVGIKIVMVHGGGKQASDLSEKLGVEPKMVEGRRVTDDHALDVVKMVFAGKVNSEILASLRKAGVAAVGISGVDGGIISAVKRPPKKILNKETGKEQMVDFGHVGDIQSIDPRLLTTLLAQDFVPVMASLGGDDDGNILNINADTVASRVGAALAAEKLILATDVDGILKPDKSLLSRATPNDIKALIDKGVISAGMIPKAHSAVGALLDGVKSVHIINGRKASQLLAEVFTEDGSGTMIHYEEDPKPKKKVGRRLRKASQKPKTP